MIIYFKAYLKVVFLTIFLMSNFLLWSQKIQKTTGESPQVRVENNVSEEEIRQYAMELAKIKAIENVFGTYVEQQVNMTIKDGNTSFNIMGSTKVKGDWIETLDFFCVENFKEDKTSTGIVNTKYITCMIKGRVRASTPKAVLNYEILSLPDILAKTNSFHDDEQLYVFLKSPVVGYVSIFLEDDNAVYRLLPYFNMHNEYQNGVPIKSDTDYFFFSPEKNSFIKDKVDEQILILLKQEIEYNYIYIVFSEDEFVKPILHDITLDKEELIIPKHLTKEQFSQWLVYNRAKSSNFQDIKIKISIEPKNY